MMQEGGDAPAKAKDVPQKVDCDFGVAIEHVDSWVDGAVRLLPNIVVALVVLAISVGVRALLRRLVGNRARKRKATTLATCLVGSSNGW